MGNASAIHGVIYMIQSIFQGPRDACRMMQMISLMIRQVLVHIGLQAAAEMHDVVMFL